MKTLILVQGTWRGAWAEPKSPLRLYLASLGFRCVLFPGWSGDADGIPSLTDAPGNADWMAGGYALRFFISALRLPFEDLNFLVHSHGIAPVIYQAVLPETDGGLGPIPIRSLISVSSPPRDDLQKLSKQAIDTGMIGYHHHVHAIGWDFWARAGQLFDGKRFGWHLDWETAHSNAGIPDVGHSKLLNEAQYFPILAAQLRVTVGAKAGV